MPALTFPLAGSLFASVLFQFIGLALLPATKGFTALWTTTACIAAFVIGISFSARLIHNGVELGALTPMVTVALQMAAITVGVIAYGESASVAKIALLVVAALMVAVATRF